MEPHEVTQAAAIVVEARSAAAGLAAMPPSAHPPADVARWFAEEVVPLREVWVAHAAGHLVAVLVLDSAFLDHLYVLPAFRRTGIGSSLVQLTKALRPDGFGLWVFAANAPARALYEGQGLVAVEHGDGSGNEEGELDVRYAWRPGRSVDAGQ